MTFSAAEIDYLTTQRLGRLATVQPGGAPQVSPVGFEYNETLNTIDIGGFAMSTSQKFRNVKAGGRVAFVVDDIPSTDPRRVRCLEIRGTAEAIVDVSTADSTDNSIIRIRPERIISFGVDQTDQAPQELTPNNRDVA
jgi:pyridoxamine 5'-phosphate oxidase family protein